MQNNWVDLQNRKYKVNMKKQLGSGAFGAVYECRRTRDDFKLAVKVISKKKLRADRYLSEAFNREISNQRKMSQSNLPLFVGLYDNFEDIENLYIVMEYCDSDLESLVNKRVLTEKESLMLTLQIAWGLSFMHSMHIAHRDIKPQNILIKDKNIRIADFGLSNQTTNLMTQVGTPFFMAPELLGKSSDYSSKVDVWALNTCLYLFLTKQYYFQAEDKPKLNHNILNKVFQINSLLMNNKKTTKDLLLQGYIKDPKKRPSITDYIFHNAFKMFRNKFNDVYFLSLYPKHNDRVKDTDANFINAVVKRFLNFRNNCISYSNLAKLLDKANASKMTVFIFIKKHIQLLSSVVSFFFTKKPMDIEPFFTLKLSKSDWERVYFSELFQKFICQLLEDIKLLVVKYQEVYKEIIILANEGKKFKYLSDKEKADMLIDLNYTVDKEYLKSLITMMSENLENKPEEKYTEIYDLIFGFVCCLYVGCLHAHSTACQS